MIEQRTAEQIRQDNIRAKRIIRAEELRYGFRLEDEFNALPIDIKKQIKLDLLALKGFNGSEPTRNDDMLLRLIYYRKLNYAHKDRVFLEYYDANRHIYGRPDNSSMVRHDGRGSGATEDYIYRDAADAVSSEIF